MEKGTLILIVCVIFGLGLFMVSKLGCFIKESRKELSDERSNLQLLKKVEMSSKGRQKNADMHVIPGTVMPETGQKQKFKLHIETPSVKDYILTVSIFIGCTLIGLIFQKLYFTDYHIYPWSIAHFNFNRWISLQSGRFVFKCRSFLLFSYRTKNVISDICSWLSCDISDHAYLIRTDRNTCGKTKRACKVIGTAGFLHTDFI